MPRRLFSASGPDPVDVHVGRRLREMRLLKDLSQSALGERMGVTYPQIQKYERGINRLSSSMLWRAAEALDVPVSCFFDRFRPDQPVADQVQPSADELDFVRHFRRLSLRLQRSLTELAEGLVEDA